MLGWLGDDLFVGAGGTDEADDAVAHFDRSKGVSWSGDWSKERRAGSRGWSAAGAEDLYLDGLSSVAYRQRTNICRSQKQLEVGLPTMKQSKESLEDGTVSPKKLPETSTQRMVFLAVTQTCFVLWLLC